MNVLIELDEKLVVEIDEIASNSNKNRLQYISESLQKVIQQDKRKQKYSEEDVSEMYADAYRKHPQTAEEIDEWEEVQHWEDE